MALYKLLNHSYAPKIGGFLYTYNRPLRELVRAHLEPSSFTTAILLSVSSELVLGRGIGHFLLLFTDFPSSATRRFPCVSTGHGIICGAATTRNDTMAV